MGYNPITVASGGTLNATGTTSSPITFTSYRDDSVGGDTNNDGPSSGASGDYGNAIYIGSSTNNATVNVTHVNFRYATSDLNTNCQYDNGTTITITDSSFDGGAQLSSCDHGVVSMMRNQFTGNGNGNYAISVISSDVSSIVLAGTDKNVMSGSGMESAVYVNNSYVPANAVWSVSGSSGAVVLSSGLTINGTLTLEDGAIVKANQNATAVTVTSDGTLNAIGTSSVPVVFTSYRDDSVGGDTNGDGSSSGTSGDYSAAAFIASYTSNATVNIVHGDFRYGSLSLNANCQYANSTTITLNDSVITGEVQLYACDHGVVSMQRNQFMGGDNGYYAIAAVSTEVSGIALAGTDGNVATGNGTGAAITLINSYVSFGATWSVAGSSGIALLSNNLTVYGTLDLENGAVVKVANSTYHNMTGVTIASGGILNAVGTSANPVIFTSYRDDNLGGDTNGDGSSTGSSGDYGVAILASTTSAMINVTYARFLYASLALNADCQHGSAVSIAITNSLLQGEVELSNCDQGSTSLQGNDFSNIGNGYYAIAANNTDVSGIVLSGSDQNVATESGMGNAILVVNSYIPSGLSWSVSGSSGMVIVANGLTVNGTLNLESGTLVKVVTNNYHNVTGITLASGATLNAAGTSGNPVVFTSDRDDSLDGDSNGDGPSSGANGDYELLLLSVIIRQRKRLTLR